MVRTPWGDAEQLRSRMLRPGFRLPAETVARNQRWRLLAAMVAVVSERGYERTGVAHLVELSGVSRKAFYRHFANKEECLIAAVDATVELTLGSARQAYAGEGSWDERLGAALEALVEAIIAQPAAARMCLLEVHAAGPRAVERADQGTAAFARMVRESLELSPERTGMPGAIVDGMVGGVRRVIATRLRRGEEAELRSLVDDLLAWGLSYRTPPASLRRPRTRPTGSADRRPGGAADNVVRIQTALAALAAEKGYAAMTLDDVAAAASTSHSTFYSHYRTKEEAFLDAYEATLARALETTATSIERAPDWPHAVRDGLGALLAFLAAEAHWAHAGVIDVLAVGPKGIEQRDRAIDVFVSLLEGAAVEGGAAHGRADGGGAGHAAAHAAHAPAVTTEAIGGAIYSLVYDHIRRRGADRLLELHPTATFMALAPFLGSERALAVANEPARGRPRAAGRRGD